MTARLYTIAAAISLAVVAPALAQSNAPQTIDALGGVLANDADAIAYSKEFPSHVRPALLDWIRYNSACRGGSGTRVAEENQTEWLNRVCAARDGSVGMMRLHGYCYGREGEAGYENEWHACTSISNGNDQFSQ